MLFRVALLTLLLHVLSSENGVASRRILGGDPAPAGRYPYIVGMLSSVESTPFCGGTLIAPTVVLTAAHCGFAPVVTVGCQNQADLSTPGCELIQGLSVTISPNYTDTGFGLSNDFSVLVLFTPSTNKPMGFLPSAEMQFEVGQLFTVVGFGRKYVNGPLSPILLQAEIDFFPEDVCNQQYSKLTTTPPIDDSMICAAKGGDSVCNGDSGGPLIVPCEETGEDLHIGIVSWGIPCASVQYPAVFAKVSFGFDFINAIVQNQSYTLNTVSSFDDFCVVNGTKAPTPPTPPPTQFPTFPSSWTCSDFSTVGSTGVTATVVLLILIVTCPSPHKHCLAVQLEKFALKVFVSHQLHQLHLRASPRFSQHRHLHSLPHFLPGFLRFQHLSQHFSQHFRHRFQRHFRRFSLPFPPLSQPLFLHRSLHLFQRFLRYFQPAPTFRPTRSPTPSDNLPVELILIVVLTIILCITCACAAFLCCKLKFKRAKCDDDGDVKTKNKVDVYVTSSQTTA